MVKWLWSSWPKYRITKCYFLLQHQWVFITRFNRKILPKNNNLGGNVDLHGKSQFYQQLKDVFSKNSICCLTVQMRVSYLHVCCFIFEWKVIYYFLTTSRMKVPVTRLDHSNNKLTVKRQEL